MAEPVPTEDQEQTWLVSYLQVRNIPHFRVPNETFTRSFRQRVKNTRLGVVPGVPDLFVLVAGRMIGIEMKRTKGSSTSAEQKQWIELLNSHGVPTRICKGWLEAKEFIEAMELLAKGGVAA